MRKRIQILSAWTLVFVMLFGCISHTTALADVSIFAWMDSYTPGNTITIMWYTDVEGAHHYDCTVLNETTGKYARNRSTSSSGYDCYVTAQTAGVYKIWVGAVDASGNDITSSIIRITVEDASCDHRWDDDSGECIDCGESCPHNNGVYEIETKIVGYSISDTQHKLVTTYDEECKICRYVISSGETYTETQSHSFDKNGDCKLCDYTAGCSHDRTKLVEKDGYPAYKQDDEEQHIVDIQYERVCRDCGDVIEFVVDSARDYYREPHDFNSKGVCRNCDYVKPEEQEPLTISVSDHQSSAEIGATIGASASAAGGTGEYDYAWKVTCNGSVITETDFSYDGYFSVTANAEGTYVFTAYVRDGNGNQTSASGGSITVTVPVCPHSSRDVSWDTNYSITYTPVSDTEHTMTGYMYEYCTACYERMGSSYEMTKTCGHDFDAAGDCPSCGYTHACKHESTYLEPLGGYPSYTPYDEDEHIYDVQYSEYCANPECGKQLQYVVDSARVYEHQPHSFDANGTCSYCGYVKPEEQEPLTISVSNHQSSAEVGATISASASAAGGTGEYDYAWKVTCNGSVIAETDLSYGSDFSVSAGAEGTYVFTAYVRDGNGDQVSASGGSITVTVPVCPHSSRDVSWDTNYSITYTPVSDTEHTMTGYMYEYCTACSGRMGSSYEMTKTYGHDFDAAGDCPSCGYTHACKHESTYLEPLGGYPSYTPYDEDEHIYDVQYSEYCANPECGKQLQYVVDSAREYKHQSHSFDANGACGYCGYMKAAPLSVSVSAGQSTANAGDTISASASISGGSGEYNIAWTVTMDGTVINQTDMSMGTAYSYRADKAGTYTFTVIVQDSAGNSRTVSTGAIAVKMAHNWETKSSAVYTNGTSESHDVVTTSYQVCTICGEQTEATTTTVTEPHDPDYRDFWSWHPHQLYSHCGYCGTESPVSHYDTANGIVQEPDECCICHGHVWLTDAPYEVDGQWRENCANCGTYRMAEAPIIENCQHGKGYVNSRHIDEPTVYANFNDPYSHRVYNKSYDEAECAVCGETRQMGLSSSYEQEAHAFDSNGICTLCGYVSLNGTYDVLDRYEVYVSSNYYSKDKSTVYIGVESPVTIMLYDKFEGQHIRAANAGVTLTLNDPHGIAALHNGDVVVASNCGTFSVDVSYLGQKVGTLELGATLLSVKDEWFEYQIQSSGAVRLEDMEKIDWDDANVLLTTTTSMGEFSTTRKSDGSQTMTFNAYNNSAVVIGIGVYDANGNQTAVKLIEPHWETGSIIENGYRTFASTLRIWDSKSFNGVETQKTEITLNVPAGGYIQVLQMNEDPKVYAANIAEMFLGSIKIYNDTESLVNPTNLKEVQTLIEKLGKDEYYEIIRNYLIRTYGTNWGDLAFVLAEETGDSINAENILEALASNSDDIIKEILSNIPEAVGSTLLDKGEDAALGALAPYLYYVKHGTQALYDTTAMHELMDTYNECMNMGTNYKYVGQIIVPQRDKNDLTFESNNILSEEKRFVVTKDICDMRSVASQDYHYFITIPGNIKLELIGSKTGDDGELYYEVTYEGSRGYVPANEVNVQ